MMIRGDDGEMREMEIVATRDKLSAYQIACPILPIPMAIICGVLNIIPGEELLSLLQMSLNVPLSLPWQHDHTKNL